MTIFAEMVSFMTKVVELAAGSELSVEERNLLSVAFKNVIGSRRASWRIISSMEQKEEQRGSDKLPKIQEYRQQVLDTLQPSPSFALCSILLVEFNYFTCRSRRNSSRSQFRFCNCSTITSLRTRSQQKARSSSTKCMQLHYIVMIFSLLNSISAQYSTSLYILLSFKAAGVPLFHSHDFHHIQSGTVSILFCFPVSANGGI